MRLIKVFVLMLMVAIAACEGDSEMSDSATGQGGSMTRFAINDNYLYIVDHSDISVFNIKDNTFEQVGKVNAGIGLETIFARGEYLYLGANDAMYIYSLAQPEAPQFIFRYAHIVSCDPVVVQGNRAYVTLRGGNLCNRGTNALEIIDISNPYEPTLISNNPMQSPHGLAVVDNLLFLCEGDNGLKVFNISNEQQIEQRTHLTDLHAYDVIARDGILVVTGEDGVFQYRYDSATGSLEMLSKIPVNRSEV